MLYVRTSFSLRSKASATSMCPDFSMAGMDPACVRPFWDWNTKGIKTLLAFRYEFLHPEVQTLWLLKNYSSRELIFMSAPHPPVWFLCQLHSYNGFPSLQSVTLFERTCRLSCSLVTVCLPSRQQFSTRGVFVTLLLAPGTFSNAGTCLWLSQLGVGSSGWWARMLLNIL